MQGIEGYRLLRRIGAGGMGTVHEALDADGNRVAVKVLHPAIAADPAARERLRREVALLHRVRGQGVARVLDAEVDGVTAFVVTELIDGPTLEEEVRENGPLEPDELAGLAHGLADGLHAIHTAGVVHRDLKPGNVMLSPDGPVIIDFGIAQVADDVRLTQTGLVTGTPGYLDPDVIAGNDPGPAGDWWAWAAVLTFAATGRPPFGRGGMAAVVARVSSGVVDTEGLPPLLATVLRAALDPEPARRLPPTEVLAALDGAWDRPALTALLAAPPEPSTRTDVLPAAVAGPALDATRTLPPVASEPVPAPYSPPAHHEPPPASYEPVPGSYAPAYEHPQPLGEPWPQPPAAGQPVAPPPYGWQVPGAEGPPPWALAPPSRRPTVAALGIGLSALAMVVPGGWVVGAVALVVLLGTLGRGNQRLRASRLRRGPRRTDVARAWLGAPVHLLWAVLTTLPGLLLGAVVAGGGWWVAHAVGSPPAELHPWLLWAAAVLGLGLMWAAPPSDPAREGARLLLGALPRPVRGGLVLAALATAGVVVGVVVLGTAPEPIWAPLPTLP